MVPLGSRDSQSRGRSPPRANDPLDDEDWTVYSDTESVASSDSGSTYVPTWLTQGRAAASLFYLQRGEQDKPAYEAWNILYLPERRNHNSAPNVTYAQVLPPVQAQPSVQSDLAGMHLRAVENFQTKRKRCWAARAIRGRGKTYEEYLEDRCRQLPKSVQTAIISLLSDKNTLTSTQYRTRTWTVVAMQEQLRNQFTKTERAQVERHRFRFWKNPDREEPLVYTVVIRGTATRTAVGEERICTFGRQWNPWMYADDAESRRKSREGTVQRDGLHRKRCAQSPANHERSVSLPSYRTWSDRSESPSPSIADRRHESPPPYRQRCRRAASPIRSRSPSVRIRVTARRTPYTFDDGPSFPPTPTPPYSSTPPPGVSAYSRPGMGSPPFPAGPAYTSPFHPRPQPPPFTGPMPAYMPPMPPMPTPRGPGPLLSSAPSSPWSTPYTRATCPSCRATRPCVHYSLHLPCIRPVAWFQGVSYHPPCLICARPEAGPPGLSTYPPPPPPPPQPQQQQYQPPRPWWWLRNAHAPPPASVYSHPSFGSVPPSPPPAPNPFSPLSTPTLSASEPESVSAASSGPRTPVDVEGREIERAGSPAVTVVSSEGGN